MIPPLRLTLALLSIHLFAHLLTCLFVLLQIVSAYCVPGSASAPRTVAVPAFMDLTYIPGQMGNQREINKQINKQDCKGGDKGSRQGIVAGDWREGRVTSLTGSLGRGSPRPQPSTGWPPQRPSARITGSNSPAACAELRLHSCPSCFPQLVNF